MQGYFQDPDATACGFDGGYFHSGDSAVWHPDGSVQIQDRMKDIIISGGEVCNSFSSFSVPPRLHKFGAAHCPHLECLVAGDRTRYALNSLSSHRGSLAITELASHPDVLEVSVVGREHPQWGERPMAYVILHTESARRWAGKHAEFSSALKAHVRNRLPGFATPQWVAIVEELPVCSLHYTCSCGLY
jgi:acyl-CoA synthetase (AMP-forming)/AMP-acid ligase II